MAQRKIKSCADCIPCKKDGSKIKLSRCCMYKERLGKTRRTASSVAKKELIDRFLQREDNSVALPGKLDNKEHSTFGLTDTMTNLYSKFCQEYPGTKISKSFFFGARRPNIKLIKQTQRRMCICVKHANIALMLKGANMLPKSTQDLVAMTQEEIKASLQASPSDTVTYRQCHKKDILF